MDLMEAQLALAPLIRNFRRNLAATTTERRTRGILQSRAELLEKYWTRFQANHFQILQDRRYSDRSYVTEDIFSAVEASYSEAQGYIYDEQACLPAVGRDAPTRSAAMTSHLPRIQLPNFSGRREDWEAFRDMYRSLIHEDPALNGVQKLHYLKSSLQGDASKVVDNLPITEGNYSTAWDRLLSRFDSPRLLAEDHLRALLVLAVLREESASGLQSMLDELIQRRDALEKLGRPIEHWDDWFLMVAARSMDPDTHRAWETDIRSRDTDPTFSTLQTFLQTRVNVLLATETRTRPRKSGIRETRRSSPGRGHARTLVTTTETLHCVPCNASHDPDHCNELQNTEARDRSRLAARNRWCYNCLATDHGARYCRSSARCSSCSGRHHRLLHADRAPSKRAAPRPDGSDPKRHRGEADATSYRADISTPRDPGTSS